MSRGRGNDLLVVFAALATLIIVVVVVEAEVECSHVIGESGRHPRAWAVRQYDGVAPQFQLHDRSEEGNILLNRPRQRDGVTECMPKHGLAGKDTAVNTVLLDGLREDSLYLHLVNWA
jgi:hypothetical protein